MAEALQQTDGIAAVPRTGSPCQSRRAQFVARRSIAIDCKFKPPARWPAPHSMAWTKSGAVDLDHFSVRPLDRIGRRHALDRLRVHVDDDVLGLHLGGFLVG